MLERGWVFTADELDALPVGSTARFRTACCAAVKCPDGRWDATGLAAHELDVRAGLIGTLPVYVLDVGGECVLPGGIGGLG
jgi:hypothetical protein